MKDPSVNEIVKISGLIKPDLGEPPIFGPLLTGTNFALLRTTFGLELKNFLHSLVFDFKAFELHKVVKELHDAGDE